MRLLAFRALRIRWETKATHYIALVHFGLRADCVPRHNAQKRTPVLTVTVGMLVHGLDHAHGSGPAPERGHVPGDHEHEHGHEHHRF